MPSSSPYGLRIGDRLQFDAPFQQFRIVSRAHGNFGAVYTAVREDHAGPPVALKTIRSDRLGSTEDVQMREMFALEARNWMALPAVGGVLAARAVHLHNGLPYVQMDFVPSVAPGGPSLAAVLQSRELAPIPTNVAVSLLYDLVAGLGAIEAALPGFCHGDIKPDNVLVAPCSTFNHLTQESKVVEAKLTDFGLSRANRSKPSAQFGLGDIRYLPPDTFRMIVGAINEPGPTQAYVLADATASKRRDIYALGCTAFELLVGRPRQRVTSDDRLVRDEVEPLTPQHITLVRGDLPIAIAEFVLECLSCDEQMSLHNFTEVVDAFHQALQRCGVRTSQRRTDATSTEPLPYELLTESPLYRFLTQHRGFPGDVAEAIYAQLEAASTAASVGDTEDSRRILLELQRVLDLPHIAAGLGRAFMLEGDYLSAMRELGRAFLAYQAEPALISLEPLSYATDLANLAQILAAPANPLFDATASKYFAEEAVRLAPASKAAKLALGMALIASGEDNAALAALEEACTLDPTSRSVRYYQAVASRLQGEDGPGLNPGESEKLERLVARLRRVRSDCGGPGQP
ncbi:MAG: protein kinase [Actinomycetota bacterium]|nr:protein kinase [Actinomycetota bacterium]